MKANLKNIMKEAHKLAAKMEGNYIACLSEALKMAWAGIKIQAVKAFLLSFSFSYNWNNASKRQMSELCDNVIGYVADFTTGFASEVAKTCEKYRKVSEKQAYVIAREYVYTSAFKINSQYFL